MGLGVLSDMADTGTCLEERVSGFGLTALNKIYTVEALLTKTLVSGQFFDRLHDIPF